MLTRARPSYRPFGTVLLLTVLLSPHLSTGSMTAERQAVLEGQLDELSGLMARASLNPIEWTRGTYLAARFFAWGSQANEPLAKRFNSTQDVYTATLAGLALTLHGNDRDRMQIRQQLEQDARKRSWLKTYFGSRKDMKITVEDGLAWQSLTRVLPKSDGLQRFALICLQSDDVLVRRLGLFWGFWIPSDTYLLELRKAAARDPDPDTRFFAGHLLEHD